MRPSVSGTAAPPALPAPQKPIRFVQNSEGPYAKRRRINSACSTCRRRKTRCSGERPVCGTCIQNKHECGGYGTDHEPTTPATAAAADDLKDAPRRLPHASIKDDAGPRPTVQSLHPHDDSRPLSRPGLSKTASSDSVFTESTTRKASAVSGSQTDDRSVSNQPPLSLSIRNRMPYFRYFGPTAIMPGFKQMVVKVRGKQHGTGTTPSEFVESPSNRPSSHGALSPSHQGRDPPATPLEIPVYDASNVAPSPLITYLCQTFFTHLGCNFPFLQEERFMRDLEEKQVDAILVDAVCAIAARFSTHPTLTGIHDSQTEEEKFQQRSRSPPSEYGSAFAQRAHSAIADTFACPSVAVVQAALLLAYNEFGASRDSGLWMYLGIAIRMAQDLGMQTLEGLKYEGRNGATPKTVKVKVMSAGNNEPPATATQPLKSDPGQADGNEEEQRAVERERIDTFWAVFFLDRVISSGTGRPVTLRDRDIELSFPSLDETDASTGWPVPFPALIRVIHLYGRVTDLLNRIKEVSHVTPDVIKRLGAMEHHLTEIYQGLSPKLHFNAVNFQHYAKAGQGTNFILLHVWFHTLIVLLHQPTLLKTFEGQIQQLLPNSRELSMSSSKTITDILTFSELIDTKASVGNPFTSQPIYIAACAFLKESALYASSSNPVSRPVSRPSSRPPSPAGLRDQTGQDSSSTVKMALDPFPVSTEKAPNGQKPFDQKQVAKHTLLATAANQNYQKCYRALQSLETYWAGVKYILTVLDQKAKGVGDPLLYTREEMESALEAPRPEPSFTSPGWRRKLSWGTYLSAQNFADVSALRRKAAGPGGGLRGSMSPMLDAGQAIGWSLTGTMNSPSTSLAVLYSSDNQASATKQQQQQQQQHHHPHPPPNADGSQTSSFKMPGIISHAGPSYTNTPPAQQQPFSSSHSMLPPPAASAPATAAPPFPSLIDPALVSDADLLLNLHSPYASASPTGNSASPAYFAAPQHQPHAPRPNTATASPNIATTFAPLNLSSQAGGPATANGSSAMHFGVVGDMMIESQDIDVSALGDDMMPWLEYLPHDMLGFYDPTSEFGGGQEGAAGGT